jgi:hypothetical protein
METIKIQKTQIETLVKVGEGVYRVSSRILPIDNTQVPYTIRNTDGEVLETNYATLNRAFCTRLMDNYNGSLKRRLGVGRVTYPPLCLEHDFSANNTVGTLHSKMYVSKYAVDDKFVDFVCVDLLITDPQVIEDLLAKGRESQYASVSVGIDMSEPTKPKFYELSLVAKPYIKSAMLLSNVIHDKEKVNEVSMKVERVNALRDKIHKLELSISKAKKSEETKQLALKVLQKHFAQNRISRGQANKILLSNNFTDVEQVKVLDKTLSTLPKNILNLSSSVVNK